MVSRPTPPAPRRPLITDLDQTGREPVRRKPRAGGRPKGRRRSIGRVVIAAVVVVVLLAGGYFVFNYTTFVDGITHVNAISGNSDDKTQNILLVGDDHRPAGASAAELAELGTTQDGGTLDTDTIMILHVPASGSDPTLISIPRDSWVSVPGFGMHKINSAFELGAAKGGDTGGAKLLIQVVQNLTGLTIDHYVRISLLGFYNVVQALGPVRVCLREAVNDPYSGIDLPAGYSTLDAKEALAFVRQRHGLPDGDLDREIRQQYFLSIEAHQILTAGTLLNPVKLHNVITAVSSSIETDSGLNLLNLAAQVKGFGGHIQSATIPVSGTPTIVVGGYPVSIVQVNTAAMPAFIHAIVNPTPTSGATAPPKPSTISVTVFNGSGIAGAAGAATSKLAAIGFKTGAAQTASAEQASTTIDYPAKDAAEAKVVAGYFPGATLTKSATVGGIQIVLGLNGVTVNPAAGQATTSPTTTDKSTTYTPNSCVD